MDQRFVRAYESLDARRSQGEPLARVVDRAPTAELIAALAGASGSDEYAANVIATELLNRQRRAPYRGALVVSSTALFAVFLLDALFTGTPFVLEAGVRAYILAGLLGAASLLTAWLALSSRVARLLPTFTWNRRPY